MSAAPAISTVTSPRPGTPGRALGIAWRYAMSTGGLLSISAAHFLSSLLILHALPSEEFGILSFAFVVVALCLSASGALLIAALANAIANPKASAHDELATHLKVNLLFCAAAATICGALAYGSGANAAMALLFGIYGGVMGLRWFARAVAYTANNQMRVVASDICYSLLLLGGLAVLWRLQRLTIESAAVVMVASAVLATACFGVDYLYRQFFSSLSASLKDYAAVWHDLTRWSLLGVALTEVTANAHAYLVTFVSGSQSFALLAVGALFMRPVSLCLSALPDIERPFMARSLAERNLAKAERCVREFRAMGAAIWVATGLLCFAVLIWFPALVLKQNYRLRDVTAVVTLWAAIMIVRLLRMPESVLLQAAGEFQALARTAYLSSAVSTVLTLALLFLFGPIVSLFGILAGDAVMTAQILSAARNWKRVYG